MTTASRPDYMLSGLLAAAVHVGLFLFLVVGFTWNRKPPEPVEVTLWRDTAPLAARPAPPKVVEKVVEPPAPPPVEVLPVTPPPPLPPKVVSAPEPKPEPKVEPKREPKPADISLEQKKREQEQQKRRQEALAEEARKLAEQRQMERVKREDAMRQAAEQKRIDDDRKRQDDARRLEETKRRTEEERQVREVAAARARADAEAVAAKARADAEVSRAAQAAAKAAAEEKAKLADAIKRIRDAVHDKVVIPPSVSGNPQAEFDVRLLESGAIASVQLMKSSGFAVYDAAVERAINAAAPFDIADYRDLISKLRDLHLVFRPRD